MYTSYYASPLGTLRMQCTDEYLVALLFEDGETPSVPEEHPILRQCRKELDEYFSGKRKSFSLPLQQEGTDFQQKVWSLLEQIPFGKTLSYQQLTSQYGDLKAIRAVASANGKNKLSILVPCHRVIGSNQSLTGYAGGLWRKKWLLQHEAKHHIGVEQLGLTF